MALRHESYPVDTVDGIDFVNLEPSDISPTVSKCEIRVFYLGENRNGSYFDRETADKMAKTLRGVPIVGAWNDEKEDFGDHGEVITIEDGEVKFSCKTVPYGFTDPEGKVWYQDFVDVDDFGNEVTHTYMMTTGYLWTGQYPELQTIYDSEGKGQSMEIDEVEGHWSTDTSKNIDFFIVTDAIFSKLCILSDDVEPCMESAQISAPKVSQDFSLTFKKSLYYMMEELKFSLQEGRKDMSDKSKEVETEEKEFTEESEEKEFTEDAEDFASKKKPADGGSDSGSDDTSDDDDSTSGSGSDDSGSGSDEPSSDDDQKKKPSGKNALEEENEKLSASLGELQTAFDELKGKFESVQSELDELRSFKASREKADKDALIAKYHMLSDEDKADVIENEDKYSLDEIDAKLALAYVKRNVDFDTVDGKPETDGEGAMTFSLENDDANEVVDPMVAALREAENY